MAFSEKRGFGLIPMDVQLALARLNAGLCDERETLELFSYLIRTNLAWEILGLYRFVAVALIEAGFLTKEGKLTFKGECSILEDERKRGQNVHMAKKGV